MNTPILCLCLLEQTIIAYESKDWNTWTLMHIKGEPVFIHSNDITQIQIILDEINQAFNLDQALYDVHVCIIYMQNQAKLALNTLLLATTEFQSKIFSSYPLERMYQYRLDTNRSAEIPDIQQIEPEWIKNNLLILLEFIHFSDQDKCEIEPITGKISLYNYIFDTIDRCSVWDRARFHPERVIENVAKVAMTFLDNRLGDELTRDGRSFTQIMESLSDYIVRSVDNPIHGEIVELTEAFMYEIMRKTFNPQDIRNDSNLDEQLRFVENNNYIIIKKRSLYNYIFDTIDRCSVWDRARFHPERVIEDVAKVAITFLDNRLGDELTRDGRSFTQIMESLSDYIVHSVTNPTLGEIVELTEAFMYEIMRKTFNPQDIRNDSNLDEQLRFVENNNCIIIKEQTSSIQQNKESGLRQISSIQQNKESGLRQISSIQQNKEEGKDNILYWAGEEIVVVRDRTNTYEIIERSNVEFDYEKHRTDRFLKPRMLNNGSVASEALMKRVDEAIQTTVDKFIVNNGEGESDEVSYKFSPESNLLVEDLQYVEIHGNFYKELINKFGEITSVSSRELKKFTIITPILNIINDVPSLSPLALHNTWVGFLTAINNGVTDIGTRLKLSQYVDESLNIAFIEHGYSFEIEDAIACRDDLFNWMNDTLNKDEAAKFDSSFIDYLKVGTGEYEDGVHLCFRENVIHLPITRDELNWFTTVNDMFCKVVLSGSKIYSLLKPIFDLDIDDEERHPLNNIIIVLNDGMVISAYYSKKNDRMYLFKRDL